ncbi:MAG: DUF4231 domain-containing protein [Chloroflexi bacterium]|nr:DUF4231 domain-containing protein [Chloroflexota bacterium]
MMAVTPQTESLSPLNRNVLLQAWARMIVYDQTASNLKGNFIRRRRWVILLTLISTVASIVVAVLSQNAQIAFLLAVTSILLPVIASYLMNDIIRFTGTTSWIKYRYIAEMMRMHIFLYRMRADVYAEGRPEEEMDDLLVENLNKIRESVKWDEVIPASISEPHDPPAIEGYIKQANAYTPEDDGLTRLGVGEYIAWRLENQRKWYENNIQGDFNKMKFFVRLAQFALLLGAAASTLGGTLSYEFVAVVAVTNAVSVALTSWSNVGMFGKTYSLFQIAEQKLADQKLKWLALEDNAAMKDAAYHETQVRNLAKKVEAILLWERQEWYEMALQAQTVTDKMILGDLTRLTQRADETSRQSPGASTNNSAGR